MYLTNLVWSRRLGCRKFGGKGEGSYSKFWEKGGEEGVGRGMEKDRRGYE